MAEPTMYTLESEDFAQDDPLDEEACLAMVKVWNEEAFQAVMNDQVLKLRFTQDARLRADSGRVVAKFSELYAPMIVELEFDGVCNDQAPIVSKATLSHVREGVSKAPIRSMVFSNVQHPAQFFEGILLSLKKESLRSITIKDSSLVGPQELSWTRQVLLDMPLPSNGVVGHQLTDITITNIRAGDHGTAEMGQLFAECVNLVNLEYSHCDAGEKGSRFLANGLNTLAEAQEARSEKNTTASRLETLNLQDSLFSSTGGFDVLCGALRLFKSLTFVNLLDCGISKSGIAKLRTNVFEKHEQFDPYADLLVPDVDGAQLVDPTQDLPGDFMERLALRK